MYIKKYRNTRGQTRTADILCVRQTLLPTELHGRIQYSWRDSNPQHIDPYSIVSTNWTTRALFNELFIDHTI